MTLKSYTIEKKKETHNQTWEWEETPELLAAIEQLHKSSQAVKDVKIPHVHSPNMNHAKGKKDDRLA
tara:strand:- start:2500 stop:2700 length:201 start_codon:yes stop_codon:yes gene_type:complete